METYEKQLEQVTLGLAEAMGGACPVLNVPGTAMSTRMLKRASSAESVSPYAGEDVVSVV